MARRKSGTGTVRHRRDGRWEGRIVVGYDDRGLPVTQNVLGKSKRECEAKLKSLRARLTPPKPDKLRPDMPFGDWLDLWYQKLVKPRLRPKSREDYENEIYKHIIPRIGKVPLDVLNHLRTHTTSEWMFPSPVKPDSPLDPASVRKRIQTILDHAGCRKLRFHDLRHTFATLSLEAGMNVKTLSAIIGHNSVSTTLNVYTHVTDTMRQQAAAAIDHAITGTTAPTPALEPEKPSAPFHPYKGLRRKPGTGCITQVSENCYEGKYTPRLPNGTRYIKSVYAPTYVECEAKLAALIAQVKPAVERMKREMRGMDSLKTVTL